MKMKVEDGAVDIVKTTDPGHLIAKCWVTCKRGQGFH